ncbi:energy transducer TonB [Runella zeae]|uniref:energy transducer TonB n=1 Tax=Runella zeae TaxID=94255 RepID=UPI0003F50B88|nr:energy transducer TonB [Runella zeae]
MNSSFSKLFFLGLFVAYFGTIMRCLSQTEMVFLRVETPPQFVGGQDSLTVYLKNNLRYPTQAYQAKITGKVMVRFVVGSNGEISKSEIISGIGYGCDEEALRVVTLFPKWVPGRQSGKNVAVQQILPIEFALD